jgi:hypothetical protein
MQAVGLPADLDRVFESGRRAHRVRLPFVRHELEPTVAQRRHVVGVRPGAVEGEQDPLVGTEGLAQPRRSA